ncbi:unnamed protein product [Meloidogyne enterolobii]|uniref:Uncharacterized protein n=1 Tax=Meloidogyne enterolobii TaxID=390850 RepID=A0ACB1ADJ5_MELEN
MSRILPLRISSSLQSKFRQFHNQIHQPTLSTEFDPELLVSSSNDKKPNLWRLITAKLNFNEKSLLCFMQKQLFFAQCLKLLVLFFVAIAQILYLHPFLELFSHLEEYSAKFEFLQSFQSKQTKILIFDSLHDLNEYKKNIWMTVAVLCASLSTCSFFLFILPSNCSIRQWHIYLVGVLDAFSFACLPFLFSTRACIIQRVKMHFGQALVEAHRIGSAEKLMNKAQCSILPREKLPLCSDLILRSIFPIDLLKFLLILCAMTLAYLFVAYLIYWCIKHWVPHSDITQSSSPLCQCYFHTSLTTTTTLPLLLGNYKCNLEQQQNSSTNIYTSFSSQPLLNKNKKLIEEQIPNEPIPSNLQ